MNVKDYSFYKKLVDLPFIEAIWLFGSHARGRAQKSSDIDLAILCPHASQDQWRAIRSIIDEADTLSKIDCIRYDHLSNDDPLKSSINKDKVVLFDRTQNEIFQIHLSLQQALARLDEMIDEPENRTSYVKDATIQRFEFCIELFWKLLKKICQYEGEEVNSPRSVLLTSHKLGLIENEALWLDMMEDRNLTSHTYKDSLAQEIYKHIKGYGPILKTTFDKLSQRYNFFSPTS